MKTIIKKVGDKAPDFTLPNQEGKKISLKDLKSKKNVVIYFYPKALTPGCTTQACGIRDSHSDFEKLDTVVFGISPDESKKLLHFQNKKDLNFTLLSDTDHSIAKKYGVWGLKKFMDREYMGIKRSTFIIDKAGNISHVLDKVQVKTHHQDVIKLIKNELQE